MKQILIAHKSYSTNGKTITPDTLRVAGYSSEVCNRKYKHKYAYTVLQRFHGYAFQW